MKNSSFNTKEDIRAEEKRLYNEYKQKLAELKKSA